jgi:DNA-binding CsgD family transcriptional regulator
MTRRTTRGATAPSLLGRQSELTEIERFLGSVSDASPGVLLLSGPAGIGKTTLWQTGIERARALGMTVVSARPTEVETRLAFAALGDLLGPLLDLPLPPMPEPQHQALDAALLRAPVASPPHPLGVSLAALHVLRSAAAEAPLIVAVDDGPWVDEASARTLEFAIRRLDTDRVGFLVARRAAAPTDALPTWLATAPPERMHRLDVGPLTVDETGALLRDRLGLSLPRPTLARLHAISGGTPFYALELGRDLLRRGAWDTPDALDAPRTLERLVGARIAALSPDAEELALVAAAVADPTISLLEATLGVERTSGGLAETEAAGVLERDGDTLRFAHPLLAAAAYARARPDRVRRVHERLAEVVKDPEQRARHLARTAVGPDAAIAAALEDAAAAAFRRGASEVPAELAEEAARLTPPVARNDRHRRLLTASDHLHVSGDMLRADSILESLAKEQTDGPLLAEILIRRARIALYLTDMELAERLLRTAFPLTADDPGNRIRVHELLAGIGHLTWRGWRHARLEMFEALRLARELDDLPLRLEILGHAGTWRFGLGRPWRDLVAESDAIDAPLADVPALEHPDLQFARLFAREGEPAEARRRIARIVGSARSRGDWTSLPRLLVSVVGIEVEAGDWDRAEQIIAEAETGLLQTGEGAYLLDLEIVRLQLFVLRGDVDAARDAGVAMDARVTDLPKPLVSAGPGLALGLLELSLGNAERALTRLDPVVAEPGLGRLLPVWWETAVGLHIEALVRLGRSGEASERSRHLERRARRRGPAAALAEALRARALVLTAEGETNAAVDAAKEAVALYDGLELPFRAARAWLTLGEALRRSRQRAAARSAFEDAHGRFTALGARLWIERTASELERVPSRRPAGSALTDTERRVAELAGAGHTNKEIADALFMSVHTVEAHLTRIFRALGVQSRTELARADLDGSVGGSVPQP